MYLYQKEFEPDFDLGFNLADFPQLNDKSWHNDMSPSFWFESNGQYYILWVDYADKSKREEDTPRYIIVGADNEGTCEDPEIYAGCNDVVYQSEYFSDIALFLQQMSYSLNLTQ